MRIEIIQPEGYRWPERGHHLRIMTFEDMSAKRGSTLDVAVDVGINEIETDEGHHVLRLFHTEGTWEEKQTHAGDDPVASFVLPMPEYAYVRPDRIEMSGVTNAQDAWTLLTRGAREAAAPVLISPSSVPTAPGIRVAIASTGGERTAFMVPATRDDAVIDARVYPADPDMNRAARIRMRWDHPDLGMVLPHLAMFQIGSAAPHVDVLVAEGAFERFCRDGDVCGALAIAHVQIERRREVGDPAPILRMLEESFPDQPDALILSAYEDLLKDDRASSLMRIRRAIAAGPPVLTATVKVLRSLVYQHDDQPDVVEVHRILGMVDPGCLFTSARLRD